MKHYSTNLADSQKGAIKQYFKRQPQKKTDIFNAIFYLLKQVVNGVWYQAKMIFVSLFFITYIGAYELFPEWKPLITIFVRNAR